MSEEQEKHLAPWTQRRGFLQNSIVFKDLQILSKKHYKIFNWFVILDLL